jgi:hypothetical protein
MGRAGLPELMLALSTVCISPFVAVLLVIDTSISSVVLWFAPVLLMLALSTVYLVDIAPRGLTRSIRGGSLGRHGKAHVTYLVALSIYGATFALTMWFPGVVPFLLFFGIVPFHAAGVLWVTVAAKEEGDPGLARFRVNLAVLQLLCSMPWPFLLAVSTLG